MKMMSTKKYGVMALSLAGAMTLVACGGDDDGDGGGGGGGTNDAGVLLDTGSTTGGDTGVTTDSGTTGTDGGTAGTDGGTTGTDGGTGTPDTGTVDAGPAPMATEGRQCGASIACEGTLTCVQFSSDNVAEADRVYSCLQQCSTDADCASSTIGATTCAMSLGLSDTTGICVQSITSTEGSTANYRVENPTTETLVACADGLEPFNVYNYGLDDDEFSCVSTCTTSADCTTTGINYCNTFTGNNAAIGTSIGASGICTKGTAPLLAGDPCDLADATGACSYGEGETGFLLCVDYFANAFNQGDVINTAGDRSAGICTQLCGGVFTSGPDLACRAQRTGEVAGSCVTGLFSTAATLGICSDTCSAFPNNCTTTSPPYSCYPLLGSDLTAPTLAGCYQTETAAGAALPVYDMSGLFANPQVAPTTAENCAGRANECPADTFCLTLASDTTTGLPSLGACAFGCDPSAPAAQSGCAGKMVGTSSTTCTRLASTDTYGFCAPM